MDFKKEMQEYLSIYDVYIEEYKARIEAGKELEIKISKKDKEDIQAGRESKERGELLQDYNVLIWFREMLKLDIKKLAERILFINELALRNKIDLELNEDRKKFIQQLHAETPQLTYVIDPGSKKLTAKESKLDEIVREKVKSDLVTPDFILAELRKSETYKNA